MKSLVGLVKILRLGEKELLRNMYKGNRAGDRMLRLKLFNLIDKEGIVDDGLAKERLDGATSASAYSHLKRRLREDILNVLLLQESSKRIAQANRAAVFECWKKLTQAYVLIFRGAKTEGAEILQNAERLADKYELAAEKLLIKHLTREALYSITDLNQLNQINESIRNEFEVVQDILRSEELSFFITLPNLTSEISKYEEEGFQDRMIEELRVLFNKSRVSRVGFWYYMAYIDRKASLGQHDVAIKAGLEFLELVSQSPSIKSKNNIAGVHYGLGTSYLHLRDYINSVNHLHTAVRLFPSHGFNRLNAAQLLLQSSLHLRNFNMAEQTIDAALAHPRLESRPHLLPTWLYFRACTEFLEDKVEESFKTLNRDSYLLRKPDRWSIQYRLLEIMHLVVFKDEEWLEFKLDSFGKYLTRHKELATPRVQAALAVFRNLLRKELHFDALSDRNRELLEHALNETSGYEWDPTGAELVRWDLWYNSKMSDPLKPSAHVVEDND